MAALDELTRPHRKAEGFTLLPSPANLPRDKVWTRVDTLPLREPLEAYLARDTYPVPETADREGYHDDRHLDWWLSGLREYLTISGLLEERGAALKTGDGVLDFGCASGRTLRHFAAQGPDLDLWGYDVNRRHIEYCGSFLGPRVKAVFGTVLPHLPIPDASLALVYAFSVFTHIDEFESGWLAEIRRVLRPRGFAYITIHSDQSWLRMNPSFPIYTALMALRNEFPEYGLSDELFRSPMPRPRIVFCTRRGTGAPCNVFHSHEYVRSIWGRFLRPVQFVENPALPQAGVLLQKT